MRFRPVRHTPALVLGAIALGGAAACGGAARPDPPPPPVLSASAVAYLPSTERSLTAADLAREIRRPALAAALSKWGFTAAAERSFQGESHRLTVVDSRTLDFRTEAGARSFVAFIHTHVAAYLGVYPTARRSAVAGRRGWTFRAQSCACPGSTALWLGVGSAGRRVTWLEINGPAATAGELAALEARAP
jgi:hypothetical protein